MHQGMKALAVAGAAAVALSGCGSSTSPKAAQKTAQKPAQGSGSTSPSASPSAAANLVPFKADGISISLPGRPTKQVQSIPTPAGKVKVTMYLVAGGNSKAYMVGVSHYPGSKPLSLDGAVRGAASRMQGKIGSIKKITADGHEGRAATVSAGQSGRPLTAFVRVVEVGRVLYQVIYLTSGKRVSSPGATFQQVWSSAHFG